MVVVISKSQNDEIVSHHYDILNQNDETLIANYEIVSHNLRYYEISQNYEIVSCTFYLVSRFNLEL